MNANSAIPGIDMVSLDAAKGIVANAITALGTEWVSLSDSLGRVAAGEHFSHNWNPHRRLKRRRDCIAHPEGIAIHGRRRTLSQKRTLCPMQGRLRPEMDSQIGGFHRIGGYSLRSVSRTKLFDENTVLTTMYYVTKGKP